MKRRQYDKTYLSSKSSYVMNQDVTHLNNNEVIIAPTGNGKTTSFVEPRLLNAENQSYVIPLNKSVLAEQYKLFLESKGYKVFILDLANPHKTKIGFDPLQFIHNEEDARWFADSIVNIHKDNEHCDPYWNESATALLTAEIVMLKKIRDDIPLTLKDLISFHNSIKLMEIKGTTVTNVDSLFKGIEEEDPDSLATTGWKQISSNPFKTASNIYTMVSNRLDNIFTTGLIDLSEKRRKLNILNIAKQKTILFVITSPIKLNTHNYSNLLYSILFKELFEFAEKQNDYHLPIATHFILDDACASGIPKLDTFISIFRAIGISLTMNFQSINQLYSLYGKDSGNIILGNCDTFIFGRTNDFSTMQEVSKRLNKSLDEIQCIPYDHFVICRAGEMPRIEQRYQTYEDPNYEVMQSMYRESLNKKNKEVEMESLS